MLYEVITGFPGLKDMSSSVSLLVFDSPELALRNSRKGICRLAQLELKEQISKIIKSFSLSQKALMNYAAIGGGREMLNEEIIFSAIQYLYDAHSSVPRCRAGFDLFLDALRRELYTVSYNASCQASEA